MIRRLLLSLLVYLALQSGQNQRSGRVSDDDGRQFMIDSRGVAATLISSGTAAAPGAGTVLASHTAPTPGIYRVRVVLILSGTAETQLVNARIQVNGAAIPPTGLLPTVPGVTVMDFDRVVVGAGNLTVIAVAAATAGSIYTCLLTATRIE